MANLLLLLAVVLAGASVLFTNTVTAALGYPGWISNVCDKRSVALQQPAATRYCRRGIRSALDHRKAFVGPARLKWPSIDWPQVAVPAGVMHEPPFWGGSIFDLAIPTPLQLAHRHTA